MLAIYHWLPIPVAIAHFCMCISWWNEGTFLSRLSSVICFPMTFGFFSLAFWQDPGYARSPGVNLPCNIDGNLAPPPSFNPVDTPPTPLVTVPLDVQVFLALICCFILALSQYNISVRRMTLVLTSIAAGYLKGALFEIFTENIHLASDPIIDTDAPPALYPLLICIILGSNRKFVIALIISFFTAALHYSHTRVFRRIAVATLLVVIFARSVVRGPPNGKELIQGMDAPITTMNVTATPAVIDN